MSQQLPQASAISMNPTILIPAGSQLHNPQLQQLNATTMIQLPTSLNPVPSMVATAGGGITTSNIITSTNPNNTTTFILNPSTNAVQSLQPQQQQQVHPPTAQLINTSQINQMIASSPLIATQQQQQQQQTPQQQIQQFQLQQQQQQPQIQPVKQEPQMSNGNRLPSGMYNDAAKTNGHDSAGAALNGIANDKPKTASPKLNPIVPLDKQRLQELVREVDCNEQLEEEVEDVLLSIADEFIDNLVCSSCAIAKHRKSTTLEVKDVQLALEKNWNMWTPGFGVDGVVGVLTGTSGTGQGAAGSALHKPKKCLPTEAHKQRMNLIKKQIKKF